MTGRVFEVREFCLHDGPGPRTTVFLQGCPLRCTWCQNPEGQEMGNDRMFECSDGTNGGNDGNGANGGNGAIERIPGEVSAQFVVDEILKTADFLVASGGGVTFSGGEPLCQPDFICEIVDLLNARFSIFDCQLPSVDRQLPSADRQWPVVNRQLSNVSGQVFATKHQAPDAKRLTFAIETSGFAAMDAYQKVVRKLDLVLQDVKFPDLDGYRRWTKVEATPIFRNLDWLKTSGVPFVARIPTMPGVNDTPEAKEGIARLLQGTPNLQRIELLPYNALAGSKYAKLGRLYAPGFDERQTPDLSTDVFARYGLVAVAMGRISQ